MFHKFTPQFIEMSFFFLVFILNFLNLNIPLVHICFWSFETTGALDRKSIYDQILLYLWAPLTHFPRLVHEVVCGCKPLTAEIWVSAFGQRPIYKLCYQKITSRKQTLWALWNRTCEFGIFFHFKCSCWLKQLTLMFWRSSSTSWDKQSQSSPQLHVIVLLFKSFVVVCCSHLGRSCYRSGKIWKRKQSIV